MDTMARVRSLSMAQQAIGLRSVFPDADLVLKPCSLRWTGQLQPTDLSRIYAIQIDYKRGRYPTVQVLAPELEATEAGFLPHTFDDGTLCLHEVGQWNPGMLIVDTIVPWAAEWLLHYEMWLAVGEWFGDRDPDTVLPRHYADLPAP
jgi:hypothetical protein